MDEDLALLERWRTGDRTAGQTLFSRHFRDVYRFFEHKVGNEADDLVQRTFAACVEGRDRFRGDSTFRTYLFAIARKQLYSFLRQKPKGMHVDFDTTSIAEVVTSLGSKIGRANQIELLREALVRLPAEQQLLLELHYWHDLDAVALSEIFEIPSGTIRVRLLRARQALRQELAAMESTIYGAPTSDSLIAALSNPENP